MNRLAVLLIAVMVTACSAPPSQTAPIPGVPQARTPAHHRAGPYPITHVVIIMQENRSFDNLFYGFPKADTATYGYGHGVKYSSKKSRYSGVSTRITSTISIWKISTP